MVVHCKLKTIIWCINHFTLSQGAATSVYAATAPELAGKSGAYLADCNICDPTPQAQDAELAKKLWSVTERQLQDPAARV